MVGALVPRAAASPLTIGYGDHAYTDYEPTADNQQSKLWFHDGRWWGLLSRQSGSGDGEVTIHRLELATQRWVDTSVVVDGRKNASVDALSDGNQLYIASSRGTSKETRNRKVRVSSYTYDPMAKTYALNPGFPVDIADGEVEAIVIDRDATGTLWATFVRAGRVMVTHTTRSALDWVAPYALPVGGASTVRSGPKADQSALVRFGGNHIGILFSSQVAGLDRGVLYWATHRDGTGDRAWTLTKVLSGEKLRHINVKAVPSDPAALVLAAVKTSPRNGSRGLVVVLRLRGDGTWTSHPFSAPTDDHARPVVQVDADNRKVYVLASSPCCQTEAIYLKVASLDALAFTSGSGGRFIQGAANATITNPTGTKQTVGNSTGLVAVGADNAADIYVHNYAAVAHLTSGVPQVGSAPSTGAQAAGAAGSRPTSASPQVLSGTFTSPKVLPARESSNVEPVSTLPRTSQPGASYFGWFGRFMAFTGADVLTLTMAAAGALIGGTVALLAARRRRRTHALSEPVS
jgi:hypothetical protein